MITIDQIQTTFAISLGTSFSVNYAMVRTSAPREYDYGYVIELLSYGKERVVLIPVGSVTYQTERYGSGLYLCSLEDNVPEQWVQEKLLKRLGGDC